MLKLRSEEAGGEPRPPENLRELAAHRRVLFLVHGYNNDMVQATKAFDGFEKLQRDLAGGAADYARGWHVARVYWAGDADWWSFTSAFYYMHAIGNARRTGEIMCDDVIARLPNLEEAAFVAHSLGCRVVLETLRHLRMRASAVRVRRVAFFAAAVPTFKLDELGREKLGWAAQAIEDEWLSLYSEADFALGSTFPLGQTFAPGEEGKLPWALGLRVWPPSVPVIAQAENRGAGHSDYWGRRGGTEQERFAARMARTALRLEPLVERNTAERAALTRATEARDIAAREVRSRELGESPLFYGG